MSRAGILDALRRMLVENLRFALTALRAHKLRAGLTIVGIVIGVWTVIAMVALVTGFNRNAEDAFSSWGTMLVQFQKFEPRFGGGPIPEEERNRKDLTIEDAEAIAQVAIDHYTEQKTDAVYLIYNEFKSVIQQRIVAEKLLPIPRADLHEADASTRVDYIYEPSPAALFDRILPGHVRVQVWRALLESAAAENAARMTAMDAATKNASEMIDSLTLYMNKVRQAGITREIIEVVSGAEAL